MSNLSSLEIQVQVNLNQFPSLSLKSQKKHPNLEDKLIAFLFQPQDTDVNLKLEKLNCFLRSLIKNSNVNNI